MRRYKKHKRGIRLYKKLLMLAFVFCVAIFGFLKIDTKDSALEQSPLFHETASGSVNNDSVDNNSLALSSLPEEIPKEGYVYINDNVPLFSEEEITANPFEEYGSLDDLGRCTYAISCIDISLMPTEERGDISSVYPTGWQQESYDFIDGGYLYNRCHLVGFQLTGENANEQNLITGTRFLNLVMLEFENEVAEYVQMGGTVLYRVIPIFEDDNLLASGVTIEALSVSSVENKEDISFYVYCYNVQPGVDIDYSTGASSAA